MYRHTNLVLLAAIMKTIIGGLWNKKKDKVNVKLVMYFTCACFLKKHSVML